MARRIALAWVAGLALVTTAWAQPEPISAAGAALNAAGGGGLGTAAQGVTVNECCKCCSIWDFLGVGQITNNILRPLAQTRLGTAVRDGLLGPVARAVGLTPGLESDVFAKEPNSQAMQLANELKKEKAKIPLKKQAIKFLAQQDCRRDEKVVDALLQALDDPAEEVRWEALKALHRGCASCGHNGYIRIDEECGACCLSCQCQQRVIDRLTKLLYTRYGDNPKDKNKSGCLVEDSARIRNLALRMIQECLACQSPPPVIEKEEEKEERKPESGRERRPESSGGVTKTSFDVADGDDMSTDANKKTKNEVNKPKVVNGPLKNVGGCGPVCPDERKSEITGRKHLFGELFGYR